MLHALDLRYAGQAFEVTIPLPDLSDATLAGLPDRFGTRHEAIYGHRHARPIEVVTLRVTAQAPAPAAFALPELPAPGTAAEATRAVYAGGWHDSPVLRRDALAAGQAVDGPAIVEETGSTLFLPERWRMVVEPRGTLQLVHGGGA